MTPFNFRTCQTLKSYLAKPNSTKQVFIKVKHWEHSPSSSPLLKRFCSEKNKLKIGPFSQKRCHAGSTYMLVWANQIRESSEHWRLYLMENGRLNGEVTPKAPSWECFMSPVLNVQLMLKTIPRLWGHCAGALMKLSVFRRLHALASWVYGNCLPTLRQDWSVPSQ